MAPLYHISNDNPQEDNFRNLILCINKRFIWCIVNPTNLIDFPLLKGHKYEKIDGVKCFGSGSMFGYFARLWR